jgi:adenine-specific DNA-methyltransferase
LARENFIESYVWESNFRPDNSSPVERENSQHILCYARAKKNVLRLVGGQKKTEGLPSLTKNSMKVSTITLQPEWLELGVPDGVYGPGDQGSGYVLEDQVAVLDGRAQGTFRLSGRIIWSQSYLEDQVAAGTKIVIKGTGFVPYSKKSSTAPLAPTSYLKDRETEVPYSVFYVDGRGATKRLRTLLGGSYFENPKDETVLQKLVEITTSGDDLVMDFFAGLWVNSACGGAAERGRRRQPGLHSRQPSGAGPDDSAAIQDGLETVADITRLRLKRVIESVPGAADGGLKAFRLASSSFKGVSVDATNLLDLDLSETTLSTSEPFIEDLGAEILVKEGVALDESWEPP